MARPLLRSRRRKTMQHLLSGRPASSKGMGLRASYRRLHCAVIHQRELATRSRHFRLEKSWTGINWDLRAFTETAGPQNKDVELRRTISCTQWLDSEYFPHAALNGSLLVPTWEGVPQSSPRRRKLADLKHGLTRTMHRVQPKGPGHKRLSFWGRLCSVLGAA